MNLDLVSIRMVREKTLHHVTECITSSDAAAKFTTGFRERSADTSNT